MGTRGLGLGGFYLGGELGEEGLLADLAQVDAGSAAGVDDLDVGEADGAEYQAQVDRLQIVGLRASRGCRHLRKRSWMVTFLFLSRPSCCELKVTLTRQIQALTMAGMLKLYIGVPRTMWSAAWSSAMRVLPTSRAFFISGEWDSAG